MKIQRPFNFKKWIDDHRDLLKPPVGNQCVYEASEDFIVMVVGGPNQRKDFHYNEGEEFFYQLEGDITLKIIEDGNPVEIPIRAGEIFLLPPKVPHSPQRPANTIGLVIERTRKSSETDGLMWFCDKCHEKIHEEFFSLQQPKDIVVKMKSLIAGFKESEDKRKCSSCGSVLSV